MSAERELLFGLLALQTQCVTRDELIAAVGAWTRDKSRPLAEILHQQGVITPKERDLIEPLVELHLKKHDAEPHHGLSSLSSFSELTSDFEAIDDAELKSVLLPSGDAALQTLPMRPQEEADDAQPPAEDHTQFTEYATLLGTDVDATSGEETIDSLPHGKSKGVSRPDAASRFVRRYRLGVGGQGEVWLAHDPELDRFVALKIIKPSERGSQDTVGRFWREAEVTGKLEHPNIVPVYEAASGRNADGESSRSPYYAMRVFGNRHLLQAIEAFHTRPRQPEDRGLLDAMRAFQDKRSVENERRLDQALAGFTFNESLECDRLLKEAVAEFRADSADKSGRSLHDAILAFHEAGRPNVEFRELLNRFIDICNAMGYAHSRRVIHRDLKPQNVMLGEFGETLVIDWGLAKVIGQDEEHPELTSVDSMRLTPDETNDGSMTRMGTVRGTLAYMPPEQAKGRVDQIGPAADIYSLGGILYTILTSKSPRGELPITRLIEIAKAGTVATPSSLQSDTPKALEAICLKALSPDISNRYATANDLGADVGRWLADEPVSAWKEPFTVRARRWVKHHQTVVGSTAAAVLVAIATLSAMVAVVSSKNDELAGLNSSLETSNHELTAAGALLKERLGRLDLERGHRELLDGRIEDGWAYLSQAARELPPESELHQTIANYWSVTQSPLVEVIHAGGEVHAVACGPDSTFATGSSDGNVQLWDVATGTRIGEPWEHPQSVRAIAFSPDGNQLVAGCDDGFAYLWDIAAGERIGEPWQHAGAVGAVAFSPDGLTVVTGCDDDSAQLWNPDTGSPVGNPLQHDSPVRAVAFSPDSETVITGSLYGAARLWNVDTGEAVGDPWQHDGPVNAVTFSPDGESAVTGSGDGSARRWDLETGTIIGEPWKHEGPVNAVTFSPDGRYVVTGNFVDSAWLWDVASGTVIGEPWKHHRPVGAAAFSRDGRYVVTGSGDGKARLWDLEYATAINEPWPHEGPVRAVAYHPDGKRVLSASTDGMVRLWNVETGELIGEPWLHDAPVDAIAFSPNGRTAITGSFDGMARLWDVETGEVIGEPWMHDGPVNAVALSPDGSRAMTGSWIGIAQLWDVGSGEAIGEPWEYADWVRCVAFSSDNRHVLIGCGTGANPEGFAQLWNIESGTVVDEPWKHGGPVLAAAFSPDGQFAVTGSVDGFARLWDVKTGTIVGEPWQHEGAVSSVAFSPDGQRLVTVCLNLVQMWDVATSSRIGTLFGREDTAEDAAFSPDGGKVVIGFSDTNGESGFVKIWDVARPFHPLLPEGQFGRTLDEGQLRDLSDQERLDIWGELNADHDWREQFDGYQKRRWEGFLLRSAAEGVETEQ